MKTLKELQQIRIEKDYTYFDPKTGLLTREVDNRVNGYHSKAYGYYSNVIDNFCFAGAVLITGYEKYYDVAKGIIDKLCDVQDKNPDSETYGLWSYYYEEPLDKMIAPDWNWADFCGKWLVALLKKCPEILGKDLVEKVTDTVKHSSYCSMKRNVDPGYTNIAIMSSMHIICASEILKDDVLFNHGKKKLSTLLAYTDYNTSFSEYNSSTYTIVAIEEIAKMLCLIEDKECLDMAKKLNRYAWMPICDHFNMNIMQLSAPQLRAYTDIETGNISAVLYLGTDGKYGKIPEDYFIGMDLMSFPISCPDELLGTFEFGDERFISHHYAKKDVADHFDCWPNLFDCHAYTYMTKDYSIGCFNCQDLWVQRRPLMAIWGKDKPAFMRLHAIHNDYDFCSGLVYAKQNKNKILAGIGLCTDHGSFHFVLDKSKDGIYDFERLYFSLEFGGYTDELTISQNGDVITVCDRGITFNIKVCKWMYDGNTGKINVDNDKKVIEFICVDTPKKVNINKLSSTFGIFTIAVNDNAFDADIEHKDNVVTAKADDLKIRFSSKPLKFEDSFLLNI